MDFRSTKNNSIHYHVTIRSIRIVCQCGVHCTDYVVAQTLIVSHSFSKLFSLPELRFVSNTVECKVIRIEFIDSIITGQNFDVFIFGVDFEVVNHFSVTTLGVVQHQFRFCRTGSQGVSVFRNYCKVIPRHRCVKL